MVAKKSVLCNNKSVINDGCDILVTIYECIILFYQIVELFKGGPNSIIEYGPPGPFSMRIHIISDTVQIASVNAKVINAKSH